MDLSIVWKLERLGRSLRFLAPFIDSLEQQCIGFKSLTDGINTTSTNGLLVLAFLAEFEKSLISERIKNVYLLLSWRSMIIDKLHTWYHKKPIYQKKTALELTWVIDTISWKEFFDVNNVSKYLNSSVSDTLPKCDIFQNKGLNIEERDYTSPLRFKI